VQNEEAEELMRKVEKEEELASAQHPDKQCLHLCIINLVIGTLYCSKVSLGSLCIACFLLCAVHCVQCSVWPGPFASNTNGTPL